jgi:DNA-binding CsgD family transcriptional regulator
LVAARNWEFCSGFVAGTRLRYAAGREGPLADHGSSGRNLTPSAAAGRRGPAPIAPRRAPRSRRRRALIDPVITRRLISRFALAARGPAGLPDELRQLTARELDVLRLIARGLSNIEIARELVVVENTVKTHVSRILMKLGLRDRVQAVVLAYALGFVTPEDRPRGPGGSSRD